MSVKLQDMGSTRRSMEIMATLSAHNDERDVRDEQLWDELYRKVAELIADPRYAVISPYQS